MLKGTPHAMEREYVFKTLSASAFPTDANDAAQAAAVSAYWTQFAKSGDPNGVGRRTWPRFKSTSSAIIEFTNEGPESVAIPRKAAVNALSALYP